MIRIDSSPIVDDALCHEINIDIVDFTSLNMAPLNPSCSRQLGRTFLCKSMGIMHNQFILQINVSAYLRKGYKLQIEDRWHLCWKK